jgi:hypothetical protein
MRWASLITSTGIEFVDLTKTFEADNSNIGSLVPVRLPVQVISQTKSFEVCCGASNELLTDQG